MNPFSQTDCAVKAQVKTVNINSHGDEDDAVNATIKHYDWTPMY